MRRFVEDYPSVDIGLLKRRGLFAGSGHAVEVKLDEAGFQFERRTHREITVKRISGGSPVRLGIETRPLRYGERRYFVCPKSGGRATKLYLVEGEFASREGHGLVHLTTTRRPSDIARAKTVHVSTRLSGAALGKGPARGRRKKVLVQELAAVGSAKWIDPAAAQVIHRDRLRSKSRRLQDEAERWSEGSSTRYALEHGRAGEDGWTEEEVLEFLAEPLERAVKGVLETSTLDDLTPDWLASRARLDVRSLDHAGLFEVDDLHGAALRWDRSSTGVINYVLMAADFRDAYHPFLLILSRDTYDRVDHLQIISIEYCAGRWYFRCPISGSRRTTLYLREGLFGSDKALKLRKRQWDPSEDPEIDPDDYDLQGDIGDDDDGSDDYPV